MEPEFEILRSWIRHLIGTKVIKCSTVFHLNTYYIIGQSINGEIYHWNYTALKPLNCSARKMIRRIKKEIKNVSRI